MDKRVATIQVEFEQIGQITKTLRQTGKVRAMVKIECGQIGEIADTLRQASKSGVALTPGKTIKRVACIFRQVGTRATVKP